ncbi:MAG TPA: AsmA family protein, partial [Terriglobales bacterium]
MNWKRVAGWIAIGILSLILVVVVAATILLHSERFHRHILAKVQSTASESLNARVTVRDFNLNLHNLTVDMNGVVVAGTGAEGQAPLLTADQLHADINVISLLQRTWYLNDIEVHHPVVHVYVDKQGNNNLPKPKTSNSKSQTNIFDLGVRHVLLADGEVYYNDRKSKLGANLRDLTFRSTYSAENGGRYYGELSYRDGRLQYGNYDPLPHDLDAKFDATRSGLKLAPLVMNVGDSRVELAASIMNYDA